MSGGRVQPAREAVVLDDRSFVRSGATGEVLPLSHLALVAAGGDLLRIEAGYADPASGADPLFAAIHRDEAEALFRMMVDAYYRGLDEVATGELVALKLRFGFTGFEIALRRAGNEQALVCPPSAMMRLAHGLARILDRMAAPAAGPPPAEAAPAQP